MKSLLIFTFLSLNSFAKMQSLPKLVPTPKDNKITNSKIHLGKTLFFDPRLSSNGTISCNSCHNVMAGGEDNRSVSVGVLNQRGGRSAPTVWNAAFQTTQFWDGRAASLEAQAVGPITNPIEMGMKDFKQVTERLKSIPGYVKMFNKSFGKNSINKKNIGKAIATFERTLITRNSPFDKYINGNKKALGKSALRGMKLVEEVGCTACHTGVNFSGEGFKMGEGNFQKFPTFANNNFVKKYKFSNDLGLYEQTKQDDDKNMWRVPTWRNVALTAPYFHNGSVKTLAEAVRVMAKTQLDTDLKAKQVKDIVAFLNSLTGQLPKITAPHLPLTPGTTLIKLEY